MNEIVKQETNILMEMVKRDDIDPERLEKLMDLQFKYEAKQAEKLFNEAISEFQKECPVITKNKEVNFTAASGKKTNYNYAPLDQIIFIIKPILAKFGLSYTFDTEKIDEKKSKLHTIIKHKDGHKERSVYEYYTLHDDQRMNSSQRAKSALSYAKRAGLENALGIVTQGEDDDAIRATDHRLITDDELKNLERLCKQSKSNPIDMLNYISKINKIDIELFADLTEKDYKLLKNQCELKIKRMKK